MRGRDLIVNKLASATASHRGGGRDFRRAGDDAREQRDWAAAAEFYRSHLEIEVGDAAIWVQLGHALKEQGLIEEAITAYRRATELFPDSADAQLQLGRGLHLAGYHSESIEVLSVALRLSPSKEAYRALCALGEQALADELMEMWIEENATSITLYDITDLLGYLRAHKTLSGIQRVQANIAEQILTLAPERARYHRFVISNETKYLCVEADSFLRMIRYATGASVDHERLSRLVSEVEAQALPIKPVAGQVLMILGAFWGNPNILANATRMKSEGLCVGVYIYDLIPITHPEFCDHQLAIHFAMAFATGLLSFDFVLTISEHVAREVRAMMAHHGHAPVPVFAVPLAHVLKTQNTRLAPSVSRWTSAISRLRGRSYVLFVSTIEARKNHNYLFRIWREMISAGYDMPDLAFVGRPGWRVDDLVSQFRDTNYLDGCLHILHDLSDDELATLYRNCLFTVFPSFVEGWGLPVGESLSYGAPCIASSSSSIPEVGRDLVEYIDPLNLRDGIPVFERMIFDNSYREACREKIQKNFKARDWANVAEDFLVAVARIRSDWRSADWHARRVSLPPGRIVAWGDFHAPRRLPSEYIRRPICGILSESWHCPEGFGVWMDGDESLLAFQTELPPSSMIILYLRILGAPQVAGHILNIADADHISGRVTDKEDMSIRQIELMPNQSVSVRLHAWTGPDGCVEVVLKLDRKAAAMQPDHRRFAAGISHLGWAPAQDVLCRQEISERWLLEYGLS